MALKYDKLTRWVATSSNRGYVVLIIVLIFMIPTGWGFTKYQRAQEQRTAAKALAAVEKTRQKTDASRYIAALKSCARQNTARRAANAQGHGVIALSNGVLEIADIEIAARKAGKDQTKDKQIVVSLQQAKTQIALAKGKVFFVAQVKCAQVIPNPNPPKKGHQ